MSHTMGCALLLAWSALIFGPPIALILGSVSEVRWIAVGAILWTASVVLKILAGIPINAAFSPERRRTRFYAATWGSWSALCELGAVALYFVLISRPVGLGDAIAIGVGAGSVENLILIGGAAIGGRGVEASPDWHGAWMGVFERLTTAVGHSATRGLVWVGWVPAGVAFATFALVDGVASYGTAREWNWKNPRLSARFNVFLAVIAAIEVAAFAAAFAWLKA